MIKVITPTIDSELEQQILSNNKHKLTIFLAGTIDNGDSENWQDKLIWHMKNYHQSVNYDSDESIGDIIVFNPRRENWNSNATIEEHQQQIKWEQDHLDNADLIIMYLADNSKSPISLLELGLYGPDGKMIVFCTPNFYRYTNVKMTCDKYNIPIVTSLNIDEICSQISEIYEEIKEY